MKSFRSARLAPPDKAAGRAVRIFQSETAEILASAGPTRSYRAVFLLTSAFLALLLASFCIRIDRVVTSSSGTVVTVEPTMVLGSLDQSIIKSIEVREGQKVAKGEVLATLDPTFTTADVGALKAQVANYGAELARCQAELAQKPFEPGVQSDPMANSYITAQRAYYVQRKAQFEAQLRSYNDQIAQYKATIAKYQSDQARYGDRARISKEIEQMRATLAAAQVGSRLNLLAATDQKLEIERALEFDRNATVEAQHQVDAVSATRDAYVQQWYAQVSQELVSAQGSRDAAAEQLTKAAKHQDLVRLEAPDDGMVLKIAKLSQLSVLNQGEPFIYLAPLKSPFEAELHIAARDIGFIRMGDRATIKLDAYNFIEHGTAEGTVRSISEGAFTTDDNGQPVEPYYRVRVQLDPISLHNVPESFRLVPGITLAGDIHIGSRSLFMYIVGGAVRGVGEPMRERD